MGGISVIPGTSAANRRLPEEGFAVLRDDNISAVIFETVS